MRAPRGPEPCPICGTSCPCHDWNEVDIGVGAQTFEHVWLCETHGRFGYAWEEGTEYGHKAVMQDWDGEGKGSEA